jgi:allantoicase
MAESLIVSGLVTKRSELAGEVEHHRRELQRLADELGHVDATIVVSSGVSRVRVSRVSSRIVTYCS